jgi:hypothetical protein
VASQFPDETHKSDWKKNALTMAKQPIFIEVLMELPDYFPGLLATLPERALLH